MKIAREKPLHGIYIKFWNWIKARLDSDIIINPKKEYRLENLGVMIWGHAEGLSKDDSDILSNKQLYMHSHIDENIVLYQDKVKDVCTATIKDMAGMLKNFVRK